VNDFPGSSSAGGDEPPRSSSDGAESSNALKPTAGNGGRGSLTQSATTDSRLLRTVLELAALSGPFQPTAMLELAIAAVDESDARPGPSDLVTVAANLAEACDSLAVTREDKTAPVWLLNPDTRRKELARLAAAEGGLGVALARRREKEVDPPTDDLLRALEGIGPFEPATLASTLEHSSLDLEGLKRVSTALSRAGALAAAYPMLPLVQAAMVGQELHAARNAVADREFVGRDDQLELLAATLDEAATVPVKAVYVQGFPGIGKTTLLDQAARRAQLDADDWIVVRLDFDRAGLDVLDWPGLTLELTRQIAGQLRDGMTALTEARRHDVNIAAAQGALGDTRQAVSADLLSILNHTLSQSDQRVMLLLDTLEVVRARGETHPGRLFEWLDLLAEHVPHRLFVLAAGRGEAIPPHSKRVATTLALEALTDSEADLLLGGLGVAPAEFPRLRRLAAGNPLALRLAARIPRAELDGSDLDHDPESEFAAAYLYRFLLSRIDDPDLRSLANPGLVVRTIDSIIIREVIGPAVGLHGLTHDRAEELFHQLADQHWLVQPDPNQPGHVRHRSDIRAELLPLLYRLSPKPAERIDRAAVKWFGGQPTQWAQTEAAYHRLQLLRTSQALPAIDPQILMQFDAGTVDELPPRAQDLVLSAQGHRTTRFRGRNVLPQGSRVDYDAIRELRSILERGDWREGAYLYRTALEGAMLDARDEAADTARAYLWRSGQWREARRLLNERDRLGANDEDIGLVLDRSPQEASCRLEMRAELQFRAFVSSLRADPHVAEVASAVDDRKVRSSLRDGALAFARLSADRRPEPDHKRIDPVSAAASWWGGDEYEHGRRHGRVQEAYHARLRRHLDPGWFNVDESEVRARGLATLSPFLDVSVALFDNQSWRMEDDSSVEERRSKAFEYLHGVFDALAGHGALDLGPQRWDPEVSTSTAGVLENLRDAGILAEAIGVAAYLYRDADLNLLARSAERWRRTTAGSWGYEAKPKRARGTWSNAGNATDLTLADRIDSILEGGQPIERALQQLDTWKPSSASNSFRLFQLVRRRAPERCNAAAISDSPHEAARILQRGRVPGGLIPPVSVLLTTLPQYAHDEI
jgi:hypothetical protein